jgi:hypothetical protein
LESFLEKLEKARDLILEVEQGLLDSKNFCPYEIGFTLRKLEESINLIKTMEGH